MSVFGAAGLDGEIRWWHEFGREFPAGADSGARGDVAYHFSSGRFAVGQFARWPDVAASLRTTARPVIPRSAADELHALGFLERRIDEGGVYHYGPTEAGILERQRIACDLWPVPSRLHRHHTREEAIARRWAVGDDPSVYEAPCCPIAPSSPEAAAWAAAGKPLRDDGGR